MTGPRPTLVVGAVLAGLIVLSHSLLSSRIGETNDLLRTIVGAQQRGLARAAPSYDNGTTTFGGAAAADLEVVAPDGEILTGMFQADFGSGLLTVTSSDRSLGQATRQIDPFEFNETEAGFDLPNELLLELHGWPRERWPEGWLP